MKKQIRLYEKEVEYTLRTSNRARRMRLAVYCEGDLVVTVPFGTRPGLAEQFIAAKAQWILDKLEYFSSLGKRFFIKSSGGDFFKYKEQALLLAKSRLEYFNSIYCFTYCSIKIKNQKTRWGSCSKKGTVSFNYKIVLLPEQLADYIVVHELCHLGEFNHSKKFWKLVEKTVPNYLALRTELKKIGIR